MNIRISFILLFLLMVFSYSFPICSGEISHVFPAVTGSVGTLINLTVSQIPGNGDIFISTSPPIGVSTQESMHTAKQAAESLYSQKMHHSPPQCSYLIRADNNQAGGYLDGPSGGGQFAILFYALISGKKVRSDAIMSATIDKNGKLGPVGGLYEKICAAGKMGLHYFITSPTSLFEHLIAVKAGEDCNVSVLELADLSDAVDFMIYKKNVTSLPLQEPKPTPVNTSIQPYSFFVPNGAVLARNIMDLERTTYNQLSPEFIQKAKLKNYFNITFSNQELLFKKGYLYTAANDAFLNYAALEMTRSIENINSWTLYQKKHEILALASSIEFSNATEDNIDWIAASEARKWWAIVKAKEVVEDLPLHEERVAKMRDLAYAKAWALAAEKGQEIAHKDEYGMIVSPSASHLVAMKLKARLTSENISQDMKWYYKAGNEMMEQGAYLGAVFTFLYVQVFSSPCNLTEEQLEQEVDKERKYDWSLLYQGQAKYLLLNGNRKDACDLARLAIELDKTLNEIVETTKNSEVGEREKELCPDVNLKPVAVSTVRKSVGREVCCLSVIIIPIILFFWICVKRKGA